MFHWVFARGVCWSSSWLALLTKRLRAVMVWEQLQQTTHKFSREVLSCCNLSCFLVTFAFKPSSSSSSFNLALLSSLAKFMSLSSDLSSSSSSSSHSALWLVASCKRLFMVLWRRCSLVYMYHLLINVSNIHFIKYK